MTILRCLLLLACALPLVGCAQMGRLPGMTDSQCVRWEMAHGSNENGPLPFDMAAGSCAQLTEGQALTGAGAHYVPLDLRDDAGLQKMAEDPQENDAGYPYVPRNSKQPPRGVNWSPEV